MGISNETSVTVTLPVDLKQRAEQVATDNNKSMSQFMEIVIKANLRRNWHSLKIMPLIGDLKKSTRVQFLITPETKSDLEKYSKRFGLSSSTVCREFLNHAVLGMGVSK